MRVAVLAVGVFFFSSVLGWTQDVAFPTLAGGTIRIEELAQGRWALGFVVIPGCPACEKLIGWFSRAAQAFPEVRFLFATPEATPELVALVQGQEVLLDRRGVLGGRFGIKRAPTVLLFVEGMLVTRLDWPFTEGALLRALAESLLVEIKVPNPRELLGQLAPGFSARDLASKEVKLADLTRPLLLAFIDPQCPLCWEALPVLAEAAKEVAVTLVVVSEAGLSVVDRKRLEKFLLGAEQRPVAVLLVQDLGVLRTYKVARSLTYFLIDGKGVIAGVWEGQVEAKKLTEEVRAALAKAG